MVLLAQASIALRITITAPHHEQLDAITSKYRKNPASTLRRKKKMKTTLRATRKQDTRRENGKGVSTMFASLQFLANIAKNQSSCRNMQGSWLPSQVGLVSSAKPEARCEVHQVPLSTGWRKATNGVSR